MSDKDEETKSQLQTYINENSLLKQELIELKRAFGNRVWIDSFPNLFDPMSNFNKALSILSKL